MTNNGERQPKNPKRGSQSHSLTASHTKLMTLGLKDDGRPMAMEMKDCKRQWKCQSYKESTAQFELHLTHPDCLNYSTISSDNSSKLHTYSLRPLTDQISISNKDSGKSYEQIRPAIIHMHGRRVPPRPRRPTLMSDSSPLQTRLTSTSGRTQFQRQRSFEKPNDYSPKQALHHLLPNKWPPIRKRT